MEQNLGTTKVENGRWIFLPDEILENIVSHLNIQGITISVTTFKIRIFDNIPGLWSILDNLFNMFCSPFITNFDLLLPYTVYKQPCSSIIFGSCSGSVIYVLVTCNTYFLGLMILPSFDDDYRAHQQFSTYIRSLELILSVCPSLESLSLRIEDEQPRKGKNSPVLIAAKNLKQLLLHLESDSNSIIEVTIDAPKLEDFDYISNCFILMRMCNSISHVKSLKFIMGSPIRLYNSRTKVIFPNLSHLTLRVSSEYEIIDAIFSMLRYCPNLEVLILEYIDLKHMIRFPIARITPIVEHLKQITVYVNRIQSHSRQYIFML